MAGLKVVVATAASINVEPLLDLARFVDAFSVSLKGFSDDFYHQALGARLQPVLEAIKAIKEQTSCWLELTNLIVPAYNDSQEENWALIEWVHTELGRGVPLHFARFVPTYRLSTLVRTPVRTLGVARARAMQVGLSYSYLSNVSPHLGNNTFCGSCGEQAIERLGFEVIGNTMRQGRCRDCGEEIPGRWA